MKYSDNISYRCIDIFQFQVFDEGKIITSKIVHQCRPFGYPTLLYWNILPFISFILKITVSSGVIIGILSILRGVKQTERWPSNIGCTFAGRRGGEGGVTLIKTNTKTHIRISEKSLLYLSKSTLPPSTTTGRIITAKMRDNQDWLWLFKSSLLDVNIIMLHFSSGLLH